MSNQGIIKDITLNLGINARKRVEGKVDIKLYSKDIATGQFEFTFIDEDGETVVLDETYSAQALVKYEDEEKTYLDDMTIEGNIIRFIFPHDFITKDGIVTMYIYITKDNYTSDVAAISFNVYRSEIDDVATDIVAAYDKNYEDILAEFKQTLEDYKSTLPKADSVRAEIDEVLNKFSEDSQAKLSQYDTDIQQVITDINEAETSRVEAEGQRESAETNRKANEADRDQAESERQTNETKRQTIFETNESERDGTFSTNETVRQENETTRQQAEAQRASEESSRASAEAQRKIDNANRSTELAAKADKVVIKNEIDNGDFSDGTNGWNAYQSILSVTDNGSLKVKSNADGVNVQAWRYINLAPKSKYYFIVELKVGNQDNMPNILDWFSGGVTSSEGVYELLKENTSEEINRVQLKFNMYAPQGDYYYIDNAQLINLTQTFGAGNEPTREEMSELIKVTGYIDGEYALNNKEMLSHLMKGIHEKANKKQEDWITPTLLNGWVNRAPSTPVRFRKNEFGRVEIEGAVKDGTLGVPAFVLPQGYRSVRYYPKIFGAQNYEGTMAEVAVSGHNFTIVKSSTTVWISLEGISYEAN